MKKQELKKKKIKVWRLIYPDKTESLSNYNPIQQAKSEAVKELNDLQNAYNIAMLEINRLRNKLEKEIKWRKFNIQHQKEFNESVKKEAIKEFDKIIDELKKEAKKKVISIQDKNGDCSTLYCYLLGIEDRIKEMK